MVIALLFGCGMPPDEVVAPQTVPVMDAVDLLTRASLDLRGARPSLLEMERVEADPTVIDERIDAYLYDERFGPRVAELFAEVLHTRTEAYYINPQSYGLDDEISAAAFVEAVGDEPLRILSRVAEDDLPYTDLVTADWTMANEVSAQIWPLDYPVGEVGWRVSHYTDGRPAAGILATNAMWWRYTSTDSNANRTRANAVSRIFLCSDYLVRPIDFDRSINLLDEEAVLEALQSDPSCVNCHASLDPLASYFYGFWWYNYNSPADASSYHPEREKHWQDVTGVAPGFYGEAGYSLGDLGRQLAADNRFAECAVENAWELLLRRDAALDDADELTRVREAFLEGGLTIRALFRAVLASDNYRAGATDEVGYVPAKLVTADLLSSQVEDLTGFRWLSGDVNLMDSEQMGFRTLAGGADGTIVTQSARSPNATISLVAERLAEAAAEYAVRNDAGSQPPRLFTEANPAEVPTDAAMVAQIQVLHARIFGNRVAAAGEEVVANKQLWNDLYGVTGEPEEAWTGLLSVLLRDPEFLLY